MKRTIFAVLFSLLLLMVGCSEEKTTTSKRDYVYMLNATGNSVVAKEYTIQNGEVKNIIAELLTSMEMSQPEEGFFSPKPEDVNRPEFEIKERVVVLNFDSTYEFLENSQEILYRAALVLTITQLDEIELVSFTVAGQPLLDPKGFPVGNLSAGSFVDISGKLKELNQLISFRLYVPSEEGEKLVIESIEEKIDTSTTLEEKVLNKLKGQSFNENATFNVMTRNNICYVDFNEEFLESYPDINDEVAIYSIVNTLSDLPHVSTVRITVNGESEVKYHEKISLNQRFKRNLDLVVQ